MAPLRFVIHEHYATNHHFDLRLERNGTLWSWAVPKGMPTDPGRNRLAVRVEDHDLDHIDFEDLTEVVGGPAGAVKKSIWDTGSYEVVRESPSKMVVALQGKRIRQDFAIFQTGGSQWIIHMMKSDVKPVP